MTQNYVSIEMARRLKEAGWKQESLHVYIGGIVVDSVTFGGLKAEQVEGQEIGPSAPMFSELLETMPGDVTISKIGMEYQAWWSDPKEMFKGNPGNNICQIGESPADALALLWISLKKKNPA